MAECASLAGSPAVSAIANASFGLFLGALRLAPAPKGVFLSPLSIVYALLLALNGAGPNTPTQTELLHAIAGPTSGLSEADLNSDLGRAMALLNGGQCGAADGGGGGGGGEMVLANSIWTHQGTQLKQAYVESMQSLFQATAREATNGAADINAWVANVTRGLITDLITTDDFVAVLANALYFKGSWEHAFKPELTRPGNFTTSTGEAKKVHMMSQLFKNRNDVLVAQKVGMYDALRLPYKNGTFSAVALLPARGVDVGAAITGWAATGLQALQPVRGSVNVTLPKFKASSTMSLVPVLKGLGVEAAFSSAAANFSRMADGSKVTR
ncbi:hypothetical protein PLESTB_000044800 [Pleodorina starrii]|uniref:Serpin domain-containing protein n=1 Tax=Pleodorina starrii TaxID=330485 RepID=A0A9W6EW69_9CHLO|nr:hypothetical protein PLESTB_000044800 [Pleodorina starrii]